jgi:hypothetical protein
MIQSRKNLDILLIDEVDVFFSEEFFGEVVRPAIVIKLEEAKNIIQFIANNIYADTEVLMAEI